MKKLIIFAAAVLMIGFASAGYCQNTVTSTITDQIQALQSQLKDSPIPGVVNIDSVMNKSLDRYKSSNINLSTEDVKFMTLVRKTNDDYQNFIKNPNVGNLSNIKKDIDEIYNIAGDF